MAQRPALKSDNFGNIVNWEKIIMGIYHFFLLTLMPAVQSNMDNWPVNIHVNAKRHGNIPHHGLKQSRFNKFITTDTVRFSFSGSGHTGRTPESLKRKTGQQCSKPRKFFVKTLTNLTTTLNNFWE
jgi:hypothetical protein